MSTDDGNNQGTNTINVAVLHSFPTADADMKVMPKLTRNISVTCVEIVKAMHNAGALPATGAGNKTHSFCTHFIRLND